MASIRKEVKKIRMSAKKDSDAKHFEKHDVKVARSQAKHMTKKSKKHLEFRKAISPAARKQAKSHLEKMHGDY